MTILDKIVADKKIEVSYKKRIIPISQLEKSVLFETKGYSLASNLRQSTTGIIAEHKRRSPSKSTINQSLNCFDVVQAYESAGVSGISVLTDGKYFGGSLDDLLIARANCQLPLLRKDFVVDEYQLYEAKAYGADVVLLIAAVLTHQELKNLSSLAQKIGLEVLVEIHDQDELAKTIAASPHIIGINNRNLKTFEVSLETSKNLISHIPDEFVKISESGISSTKSIKALKNVGFQGFLIGENFMKSKNIKEETKLFIEQINLYS